MCHLLKHERRLGLRDVLLPNERALGHCVHLLRHAGWEGRAGCALGAVMAGGGAWECSGGGVGRSLVRPGSPTEGGQRGSLERRGSLMGGSLHLQ